MESTTDPDAPSLDPLAQIDWRLTGKTVGAVIAHWLVVIIGIALGLVLVSVDTERILQGGEVTMNWWLGWFLGLGAAQFFEGKALRSPNWWGRGLDALAEALPTVRGEATGRFEVWPGVRRERTRPFFLVFAPHRVLFVVLGSRWPVRAALLGCGIVPLLALHPSIGGATGLWETVIVIVWSLCPYLTCRRGIGSRIVLHEIANDDVLDAKLATDERGFDIRWRGGGAPERVLLRPESAWFEPLREQLEQLEEANVQARSARAEAEFTLPAPNRTGWGAVVELLVAGLGLPAAVFVFGAGELAAQWAEIAALLTAALPFALVRVWLRHVATNARRVHVSRPDAGVFDVKVKLLGARSLPLARTVSGEALLRTRGDRWELDVRHGSAWGALAALAWCLALFLAPGIEATVHVVLRVVFGVFYAGALWGTQRVAFERTRRFVLPAEVAGVHVIAWSDVIGLSLPPSGRPRSVEFEVEPRFRPALLAEIERRWPWFVEEKHRAWATLPELPASTDRVDASTEQRLAAVQQRYQEIDP